MEEGTLRMGGRALDIARKLRVIYKIGSRDLTFGEWNIEETFSRELKKLEESAQQRQQVDAGVLSTDGIKEKLPTRQTNYPTPSGGGINIPPGSGAAIGSVVLPERAPAPCLPRGPSHQKQWG
jgi:hypothetical protein